jgi:hypothetical protein
MRASRPCSVPPLMMEDAWHHIAPFRRPASSASASAGRSSGQYSAGRGCPTPSSRSGRQASTGSTQREGKARRPSTTLSGFGRF